MDKQLSELRRSAIDNPSLRPSYGRQICRKIGHDWIRPSTAIDIDGAIYPGNYFEGLFQKLEICRRCGTFNIKLRDDLPIEYFDEKPPLIIWKIAAKSHIIARKCHSGWVTQCGVYIYDIDVSLKSINKLFTKPTCKNCLKVTFPLNSRLVFMHFLSSLIEREEIIKYGEEEKEGYPPPTLPW